MNLLTGSFDKKNIVGPLSPEEVKKLLKEKEQLLLYIKEITKQLIGYEFVLPDKIDSELFNVKNHKYYFKLNKNQINIIDVQLNELFQRLDEDIISKWNSGFSPTWVSKILQEAWELLNKLPR